MWRKSFLKVVAFDLGRVAQPMEYLLNPIGLIPDCLINWEISLFDLCLLLFTSIIQISSNCLSFSVLGIVRSKLKSKVILSSNSLLTRVSLLNRVSSVCDKSPNEYGLLLLMNSEMLFLFISWFVAGIRFLMVLPEGILIFISKMNHPRHSSF